MSQLSALLRTTLDRLGMTQKRLADETGLTPKHIHALAQSKVGMTGSTAVTLERVTNVPASEWLLAQSKDIEEEARAQMPTPQEEAEVYVQRAFLRSGFSPEQLRLTGRDKEVIRLVLQHLNAR